MEIYEIIKELRVCKGMTQKELGEALGVSDVTVRCWENGSKSPSMSAALSLMDVFGVSCDYLLGRSQLKGSADERLSERETSLINNYRQLDEESKGVVDSVCYAEMVKGLVELP